MCFSAILVENVTFVTLLAIFSFQNVKNITLAVFPVELGLCNAAAPPAGLFVDLHLIAILHLPPL